MKTKLFTAFLFLAFISLNVFAARPSINTLNTRVNQLEAENNGQQSQIDDLDVRVTALEAGAITPPQFGVVGTIDIAGHQLNLLEVAIGAERLVGFDGAGGTEVGNAELTGFSVLIDNMNGTVMADLFGYFMNNIVLSDVIISVSNHVLPMAPKGTGLLTIIISDVLIENFEHAPDDNIGANITFPKATQARIKLSPYIDPTLGFPTSIISISANGNPAYDTSWNMATGITNGCQYLPYNSSRNQFSNTGEIDGITEDVIKYGSASFIRNNDPNQIYFIKLEGIESGYEAPCYLGALTSLVGSHNLTDIIAKDPTAADLSERISTATMSNGVFLSSYQLTLNVDGLKQDITIGAGSLLFE